MYDLLDPQTMLIILNTVLFQGGWIDPFDPKKNVKATWHGFKGKRQNINFMKKDKDMEFSQAKTHAMVRLPYNLSRLAVTIKPGGITGETLHQAMQLNRTLAMYLILPASGSSPQKLLNSLTGPSLDQMIDGLNIGHVVLSVPRFKMEVETDLIAPLSKMGMPLPFEKHADFSGMFTKMASPIEIDQAKQKCVLGVNERGTVASAASGLMTIAGINPDPPKLEFNRPFVFLIRHDPTGEILFTGVVNQPQA